MKKIIPILLLAAACGDNRRAVAPEPPLQAHDGTYEVILKDNVALSPDYPDCGLVMDGVGFVIEVATDPLHLTVDGVADEDYDVAEFAWISRDGVRYAGGTWGYFDPYTGATSLVTLDVADDLNDNALGLSTLLVLGGEEYDIICAEKASVTGRFTPSK